MESSEHTKQYPRRYVRIAATVLAAALLAFAAFTYLSYHTGFVATDTVTVMSPRAGLVMEKDAKVKYRGIQIGTVKAIEYAADQARLTLAIRSDQLGYVPANAPVRIAGTTVFGAKSVQFLAPDQPSPTPLRPNATIAASDVQLEVNTLFQTLTEVLHKIDPVNLNATLSALAEGLRGRGDDAGAALAGTNAYLSQLNPLLPALESDVAATSTVANIYGDAGRDLVTVLHNASTVSATIVDQRANLNATLLAAIGLADNATAALQPAADNYIAAINRLRAPLKLLADYSPEFGCLLRGAAQALKKFSPVIGGTRPGLFVSSNFVPGVAPYTYPESLPIVNASGGPNCRGLPDIPTVQFGGSYFHAPFLVTDNGYIPYEPPTEVQVDAPSTLQFLFNGAFAERDDF